MKVTVTTTTDKVFILDVSEDLDLENFKAFCESESGINRTDMVVVFNGKPLLDNVRSLKALGLHNGDCVLLQQIQREASGQNRAVNSHEDVGELNCFLLYMTLL